MPTTRHIHTLSKLLRKKIVNRLSPSRRFEEYEIVTPYCLKIETFDFVLVLLPQNRYNKEFVLILYHKYPSLLTYLRILRLRFIFLRSSML